MITQIENKPQSIQRWIDSLMTWPDWTWHAMSLQMAVWLSIVMTGRQRVVAAWKVLMGHEAPAHHGASLIMPTMDALKMHPRFARALGGADRALIVQKLHEWIEFNQSEGRKPVTYNGYGEWISKHFEWLNEAQMGRHVRALEKMGVIITTQAGKRDRRKSYRLDYAKIKALVCGAQEGASVNVDDSKMNHGGSFLNVEPSKMNLDDSNSYDVPSSKPIKKRNQQSQSSNATDKTTRRVRAASAETTKAASTENDPNGTAASSADDAAVDESMSGAQGQDSPIPHSAAPLTQTLAEQLHRMGFKDRKGATAADVIAAYGEGRVRAVMLEAQRRPTVKSAAGWIIAELKADKFGLGEVSEVTESVGMVEVIEDEEMVMAAPIECVGEHVMVSARLTAGMAWGLVAGQLSIQSVDFKTWLKAARLARYECIDGVGVYSISGVGERGREQLGKRYARNVMAQFEGVHDGAVKVVFE